MSETESSFPRVTVGGDAERGWMVDIHDGTRFGVYCPEAATADEAREKALRTHRGEPEPEPEAAPIAEPQPE